METIVEFGYNKSLSDNYTGWEAMGTKYNFNVSGRLLGLYSANDKKYLLSEVTSSFGDNCMAGTIDAREVAFESKENASYILLSNNEISEECMTISRFLSTKEVKDELALGTPIEDTNAFQRLSRLGLPLHKEDVDFEEKVTVCGIEPTKFERYQNMQLGKIR